jgi:hypothetical protein
VPRRKIKSPAMVVDIFPEEERDLRASDALGWEGMLYSSL